MEITQPKIIEKWIVNSKLFKLDYSSIDASHIFDFYFLGDLEAFHTILDTLMMKSFNNDSSNFNRKL